MKSVQLVSALLAFVVVFGSITAVSWVVLKLWHAYHRATDVALAQILSRYALHGEPLPGREWIRYPTYVGSLFGVEETVVEGWIDAQQASRLLGELLRFNVKRGLPSALAPLVLFSSVVNYVAQRRRLPG